MVPTRYGVLLTSPLSLAHPGQQSFHHKCKHVRHFNMAATNLCVALIYYVVYAFDTIRRFNNCTNKRNSKPNLSKKKLIIAEFVAYSQFT